MTRWVVPLALAALLLVSCGPGAPDTPPPAATGTWFAAGEEHGYLEPCGCTRPQLGGLARKGTALKGAPLLENGDLVTEGGRLSELKFETFLLALSEIGCVCLNIGEGDLELGLDFLKSAEGMASFPLISANLLGSNGERVFPPTADFEIDGRAVRVIGVLDPALAPGVNIADPEQAVAEIIDGTAAGTEIIVLYHGSREGARRIAGRESRATAVIYAHGIGEPAVDSKRVFTPGDRSRWMIRAGPRPTVIHLSEDLPDHPEMLRAMKTYVARLTQEDLLHRMNPQAPPEHGGYVGDAACTACHEKAAAAHAPSRHAHAIESLAKTGREVDPDCIGCHVIGYGEQTGFTSTLETPALSRVGCESCHGPSREHIRHPTTHPPADARASCLRCHTEDTDPGFSFEKKWPGIRH